MSSAIVSDTQSSQHAAFRQDVREGLAQTQKTIPSRWLYDDRGSELFEAITDLPEYYPTRTETAILRDNAASIAEFCGPGGALVEYGAGASVKTEILLASIENLAAYVPIDIAGDFLEVSAARIRKAHPGLDVQTVVADFTKQFDLPDSLPKTGHRIGFFPGSTIGNLTAQGAAQFLTRMRSHVVGNGGNGIRPGAGAIIGIDLEKPLDILIPAYDDAAGVTAAFNLNLLKRLNRELGGTFDEQAFAHEARWNPAEHAIEMHLVSQHAQLVTVAGAVVEFAAGETIHTESSRKYTRERFATFAHHAGWRIDTVWQDQEDLFAVVALRPE